MCLRSFWSSRRFSGRVQFLENRCCTFFHSDEVVRPRDSVLERGGGVSVEILAKQGLEVESNHQLVDGDAVWNLHLQGDRLELFHEVTEALVRPLR